MTAPENSRYLRVSRRALLKSSVGAGVFATLAACGVSDSDVFAGAVAETSTTGPPSDTVQASTTTSQPIEEADPSTAVDSASESTAANDGGVNGLAVASEMIVGFTYTRVGVGKIESPYVAVWVEDQRGDLLETIALFYERGRRGARWLDHLDRWFSGDAARIAAGGADLAATISSATRPPGEYAVAWDGTVNGEPIAAGVYNLFVESAREEGPVSLTSSAVTLDGSPFEITLPDNGELSLATVRIDG